MTTRVNPETARTSDAVEQRCSIDIGGTLFEFVVVVPKYIAGKLKPDDWIEAGRKLKGERDRHVREAVMAGTYFSISGMQRVRDKVRQSMCDLLYERFTQKQIAEGNEAWEVPRTLVSA
jgi:hypothetical protein